MMKEDVNIFDLKDSLEIDDAGHLKNRYGNPRQSSSPTSNGEIGSDVSQEMQNYF